MGFDLLQRQLGMAVGRDHLGHSPGAPIPMDLVENMAEDGRTDCKASAAEVDRNRRRAAI
jgi:hypothetical protein